MTQARRATPVADPFLLARTRAASHLGIAPEYIEDDLAGFLSDISGDALLRARAGSGKTTALTLKAAHLVQDHHVDPSRIMMLTFNNAAARSLETRLADMGIADGIRVRTFHAFGQRIVRAHFGDARRTVFDEDSADGRLVARLMQESIDEVVNSRFFIWCASRMRTRYDKRRDYVEGVGRDALASAANFLRARGYGLQNPHRSAWDDLGPMGGNAMKVVLGFESRLREEGLLDGPGVLQAASWTVERELARGVRRPSDAHEIDWIFIDEFQDVSLPYMRLVAAVRDLNGTLNVQGVGDNWQAINGFAGADLAYFDQAQDHLEHPALHELLRNRRSGSTIVDWGNEVMSDAGYGTSPALAHPDNGAGIVRHARLSASRDVRFIAQKLAGMIDSTATSVALIARKWKVGDHRLSDLRSMVSGAARDAGLSAVVSAITAHGSKGLEYDQVLLLDDGSFPVSHPSRPLLDGLIPEKDFLREEQCLKHVAGTRARQILDVVDMK